MSTLRNISYPFVSVLLVFICQKNSILSEYNYSSIHTVQYIDCSFAKSAAFRSENYRSFGYDLKNGGPVSQQVWHVKMLSIGLNLQPYHRNGDSHQIAEKLLVEL
jgi:hypothetical protein